MTNAFSSDKRPPNRAGWPLAVQLPVALSLALGCQHAPSDGDPGKDTEDLAAVRAALTEADVQPLAAASSHGATFRGSSATLAIDVTGDRRADLVAVDTSAIRVRRNAGGTTLSFQAEQTWATNFAGGKATLIGDVSGDGLADAVAINDGPLMVRRSTGTGFAAEVSWANSPFFGSQKTFLADVDGDRKADVIALDGDRIRVRRSSGGIPFKPEETWLLADFVGTKGNWFADVNGDGKADAIMITASNVTVRPSTGTAFGPADTWSTSFTTGGLGTFFVDTTGDGMADAIRVEASGIIMQRSDRWFFGTDETLTNVSVSQTASTKAFGDVNDDSRADFVQAYSNGAPQVRLRQDREIPIRFVQLLGVGVPAMDPTIVQASVDRANEVFKDMSVKFKNAAYHRLESEYAQTEGPPVSVAELSKIKDLFNSACDIVDLDAATRPGIDRGQQISALANRCSLSGEILVFIGDYGNRSWGEDPHAGKAVGMTTSMMGANDYLAHELGHYLGLPHAFNHGHPGNWGSGHGSVGYMEPDTGQGIGMAPLWDLVYADPSNPVTFRSRAAAAASEMSLRPIQPQEGSGWYCPSAHECPSYSYPHGMFAVPVADGGGTWFSFLAGNVPSERMKGLALRLQDNSPTINVMSYNYEGPNDGSGGLDGHRRFSLAQIEIMQRALKNDLLSRQLDRNGRVIFGDRPRLGITGPAPQLKYFATAGYVRSGPGTIASNGDDSWVVGTNAYNVDGNQVYEWNYRTRAWEFRNGGAQQISIPPDGAGADTNTCPWIITDSGEVKRYDGSSFVSLPGGSPCAKSIAVGPGWQGRGFCGATSSTDTVRIVSCGSGDQLMYRYQESTGWRSEGYSSSQVASDTYGYVWVRKANGDVLQGEVDNNGNLAFELGVASPGAAYISAGAPRRANGYLQANVLGTNGHIFARTRGGPPTWTDVATPSVAFSQIAGTLPYLWGIEASTGRIYYIR